MSSSGSSASPPPARLILAITGASGAILGLRALQMMVEAGVETHFILSHAARKTFQYETGWQIADLLALPAFVYDPQETGAAIASGSFQTNGMLIAPCSIKTLSAVANSYTENLVFRAADVCLKEGRPLVLGVREAPFHRGHLRLMDLAARAGAIIYPPIPFFYGRPGSLEEVVDAMVGRWLARLGIDNPAFPRWGEPRPD